MVASRLTNPSRFAYSDGFNSSPLPFPCAIAPRSVEREEIIRQEYQQAMEQLGVYAAANKTW